MRNIYRSPITPKNQNVIQGKMIKKLKSGSTNTILKIKRIRLKMFSVLKKHAKIKLQSCYVKVIFMVVFYYGLR